MFRLMTYNIMHGGVGRIDAIANVINSCSPDFVFLQEATVPANVERLCELTAMGEWRAFHRQSLAFLSRKPVAFSQWIRPRISRHAFIEVVPNGEAVRLFGVHLSAVHAAWTEQRRVWELRALLRSVGRHQQGFHVLAGDFNTLAPGATLDWRTLPLRLRPFVWLSGGRIRWRTIQTVLDARYVDTYRRLHPQDPGLTLPTSQPQIRLDYVFVPEPYVDRVRDCCVVRHADGVKASDHFPVVADLVVDAPQPVLPA
jgi:exodeoxyribonuclease-3